MSKQTINNGASGSSVRGILNDSFTDLYDLSPIGLKRDYGAAGDCKVVTDAVVTASDQTLTSATAAFTSADVGKTIGIPYAGADSSSNGIHQTHVTTIASVTNSTTIELTDAPVNSIVGSRTLTDVATTYNDRTVTSASGNFTAGDLGKEITIPGAGFLIGGGGAADSQLYTRIIAINSSTSIEVAHACQATLTGKTVTIPGAKIIWGTDDTAAIQNAMDAGSANRRPVCVEAGRYLITDELDVDSNLSMFGFGHGVSIINPVANGVVSAFRAEGTNVSFISDVTFRNFEIDCSGVRGNTYASGRKAIYLRPVRRLIVDGMYCHRSSATAIGCDYLQDSFITNNVVEYGGTQAWEFGGGAGGSGIGIGTGYFEIEAVDISGNNVQACGNRGIFTESQSANIRSRGLRIIGNFSGFNGEDGIGDRACDGTVIVGNTSVFNVGSGIGLNVGFSAGLYSTNTVIDGNRCHNNAAGVRVNWKTGPIKITNNLITGLSSAAQGYIYVTANVSGASNQTLIIRGNEIIGEDPLVGNINNGRGIYVFNGSPVTVIIENNLVVNAGRLTGDFPAIASKATAITRLYVRGNIAYDTRATKRQSHGLVIDTGTITKLVWSQNDFADNGTGTHDFTGATISSTVTEPNP